MTQFVRKEYVEITCTRCGDVKLNSYTEPTATQMKERSLCFTCNYWYNFANLKKPYADQMTIIDHHTYSPGNRTSGSFRGMGGRRFDIEYIKGMHKGKRITTFDLWSGGELPTELWEDFPDTAVFLNGAGRAIVGETTCWDASAHQSEPYMLPITAGIR